MDIQKKYIKYNYSKRRGAIKYICIHDTGNYGASAINHYNYFNGGDRGSSADIFVDDSNIIQLIDSDTNYSWAVGDGKGKYKITNNNSISIEMCLNASGEITNKTLINTIELTKYLMSKYNIGINNVVRHYDVSKKICPKQMYDNNWAAWNTFKLQLQNSPVSIPVKQTTVGNINYNQNTKNLQMSLNKLKFRDVSGRVLVEDGINGNNTTNAVKRCQTVLGLTVDGIAGPQTMNSINILLNKSLVRKGSNDKILVRYIQFRVGTVIDGNWGNNTEYCVRQWQRINKLVDDGIIGRNSWFKLLN